MCVCNGQVKPVPYQQKSKIDRGTLKNNGWKMGACFTQSSSPELVSSMIESHRQDKALVYIAITHDCSIINESITDEPFLEYIVAKPIDK